jgi:hypothetical protein
VKERLVINVGISATDADYEAVTAYLYAKKRNGVESLCEKDTLNLLKMLNAGLRVDFAVNCEEKDNEAWSALTNGIGALIAGEPVADESKEAKGSEWR